jgi:hypothetical protein
MKKLTSIKMCVITACLLLAPRASADASVAAGTAAATRSGLVAKIFNHTISKQLTTPAGITGLALMVSLFMHFSREPDTAPNRYDLEELKANPTFKNFMKFAYYFWLDGICGHPRKSSSLKVDADGKTIEARPGVPARGLFGQVSDLVKPVGQTLAFIIASGTFAAEGLKGLLAWEFVESV